MNGGYRSSITNDRGAKLHSSLMLPDGSAISGRRRSAEPALSTYTPPQDTTATDHRLAADLGEVGDHLGPVQAVRFLPGHLGFPGRPYRC
jgi:hypothetical protein